MSNIDFPFLLQDRESEIIVASNVAATNKRVCNLFESLMREGGYCVEINGQNIVLEWPQDVSVAYRLFLVSPAENKKCRYQQAKKYFEWNRRVA